MIGIVATIAVKPGQAEAFEQAFADLARDVRAKEVGNLLFEFMRARDGSGACKVLEIYANDAALRAHRESAHVRAAAADLAAMLGRPPAIEHLDAVE